MSGPTRRELAERVEDLESGDGGPADPLSLADLWRAALKGEELTEDELRRVDLSADEARAVAAWFHHSTHP